VTVDQHEARAALTAAAAEAGAHEREIVAQRVEQLRIRIRVDRALFSVDDQAKRSGTMSP